MRRKVKILTSAQALCDAVSLSFYLTSCHSPSLPTLSHTGLYLTAQTCTDLQPQGLCTCYPLCLEGRLHAPLLHPLLSPSPDIHTASAYSPPFSSLRSWGRALPPLSHLEPCFDSFTAPDTSCRCFGYCFTYSSLSPSPTTELRCPSEQVPCLTYFLWHTQHLALCTDTARKCLWNKWMADSEVVAIKVYSLFSVPSADWLRGALRV